ncbi:MAG: hypothetical protein RJA81_2276, partial [Planctomycetota bacterium]
EGVLITDFWNAYNAVTSVAKQRCLPHLLRDLKRIKNMKPPVTPAKSLADSVMIDRP